MFNARKEKQTTKKDWRNKSVKLKKTTERSEKETYKYFGIFEARMKEKKVPQENEKTTWNQTTKG